MARQRATFDETRCREALGTIREMCQGDELLDMLSLADELVLAEKTHTVAMITCTHCLGLLIIALRVASELFVRDGWQELENLTIAQLQRQLAATHSADLDHMPDEQPYRIFAIQALAQEMIARRG